MATKPPPPPSSSGGPRGPTSPRPSSSTSTTSNNNNNPQNKYFSEANLPSCIKSGYTPTQERLQRQKTCRFLEEASKCLQLPRVTIATSMVLFHRFYAAHSFTDHDRFEVAVACLVLAAKTEESPRKLTSVISECWRLKNLAVKKSAAALAAASGGSSPGGASPSAATTALDTGGGRVNSKGYLDPKSEEFIKLKERVLLLERVILHTIGFDLSIDHPYKFVFEQIKDLVPRKVEYNGGSGKLLSSTEASKMISELRQAAMNFANDSMHTTLCLQFPPEMVATTCVYLSAMLRNVVPRENKHWLSILTPVIPVEVLVSIASQILELIAEKRGANKELLAMIQKDIENMKKEGMERAKSNATNTAASSERKNDHSNERDSKRQRV